MPLSGIGLSSPFPGTNDPLARKHPFLANKTAIFLGGCFYLLIIFALKCII